MKTTIFALSFLAILATGCKKAPEPLRSDVFEIQRRNMVRWDLAENGIKDQRILRAMETVPRHLFLLPQVRNEAYSDQDLPIGQFLTTPRPFIVARTIELLQLKPGDTVLEVGTGLGYQSALLAELTKKVYTIEIVPNVAEKAREILTLLNYKNVELKIGDGFQGWEEHAPFDSILVMASAKSAPGPLLNQLKVGGRLVMPIDEPGGKQNLVVFRKAENGMPKREKIMEVNLKPMEGKAAGTYW